MLRVHDTQVLTGKISGQGFAEWDWCRIPAAIGLRTAKDHVLLKRNMAEFEREFQIGQISFEQFHYRGQDAGSSSGLHSMESRALVLMLCLLCLKKQIKADVKCVTLAFIKSLLDTCMLLQRGQELSLVAVIFGTDFQHHSQTLVFSEGTTNQLASLLEFHSQVLPVWEKLQKISWNGYRISSSLGHASLLDVLVFILHVKSHNQKQMAQLWRDVGAPIWPHLLFMLGGLLETCAHSLSTTNPVPAPLLKGKSGGTRRVPLVNKVILLRKVKFNKSHRRLVMSSHSDLVPATADLIQKEPLLECSEYLKSLSSTFASCTHLQVSWDPSNYSGDEVLVCCIWSVQCQTAAYLPVQVLLPVATSEVSEELQQLSVKKKVTRVDGFNELRALAHALMAVSKTLDLFFLPDKLKWQPLSASQTRVYLHGQYMILNKETKELQQQWPSDFKVSTQHILVSVSDMGAINRSVLDYVVHYLKMTCVMAFDSHHRSWNDVKASMRPAKLYKTFLSMAMVFNINYGPMSSKTWFNRKRHAMVEFAKFQSPHSGKFLAYMPHICAERGELEDGTQHQREAMFAAMQGMRTLQVHGPLTKLMRWWSWWECCEFNLGELWFTKLLMSSSTAENPSEEPQLSIPEREGLTPQQELRELKIKHGGWALAPALIQEESMFQKALIFEVGRPLWTIYSAMSKNVQKPTDVQQFLASMSLGGWIQELSNIIATGVFDPTVMRNLYFCESTATEEHLLKHNNFIIALLNKRAMSLCGTYLVPPYRYSALACPEFEAGMRTKLQTEWETILAAEEIASRGTIYHWTIYLP